jgi:hypothetical protein
LIAIGFRVKIYLNKCVRLYTVCPFLFIWRFELVWTCDEERTKVCDQKINMDMEGWRERDRPKKRWIYCVRQDMREIEVSDEVTNDREECEK